MTLSHTKLTSRTTDGSIEALCYERPELSNMWVGKVNLKELRLLRNVCNRCPIKRDCANFARAHKENGVWGGILFIEGREAAIN